MPLLSKRIFSPVKGLKNVQSNESIYTIPHTKEQFRSKDEYEKRIHLYKNRIWTCQSTGHVNLTHEEAWNSEKTVLKTLKEQFAPCYDKPVLELVHHSTKSLDLLVDQAWLMLQQTLVIGEKVILKVKAGGKSMKAIVVKVDRAGVEANPTSNCNSPSSDKENEKEENGPSPKKWVPPKLLPYKYSIRFENDDSVIHSVPASDLGRGDKPPSKELLRLFIRTYAVRAGQAGTSPWIVDDGQVMKLDLQSKFASFLLSPVKWRQDEIAKKMDTEIVKGSGNKSPRIKTKLDEKEANRKEKVKKKIARIEQKTKKVKKLKEKSEKKMQVIEVDSSSSDSDSEVGNDSDLDTPLAKYQLTPKKKLSMEKSNSQTASPKVKSAKSKEKKPLTLAEIKKRMDLKKKRAEKKEKKKDKGDVKKKKKKGQDPKQLTLFDLSKKKSHKSPLKKLKSSDSLQKSPLKEQRTPDKKKLSSLMSPPKTPAVVQKIQKALKNNDKSLVGTYSFQAAKILNSAQRARLPHTVKELVEKKYNILMERQKVSRMSESEKKAYLEKQAAERKEKLRQVMKERHQALRKRYEDTTLELKPLPQPKLVSTPDGMPNEAFGDVAMVTEFIANYAGLLMPDDQYPIYTDALMKALVSGKDGFTYLSRVLVLLLQTLLQDQIAEDYQELKVHLRDVPVNAFTASELVRLSLRSRDNADDRSDNSDDLDDTENEVPDDLVQLLESHELYNLEPEQKIHILKGLCLRIMGTYSVQDFMEQKQQELSRLWKEKISHYKEDKDKRQSQKADLKANKQASKDAGKDVNKDEEKSDSKEKKEEKASSMLLTHFYDKKGGIDDGQSSGNNSEAAIDVDDGDITTMIRRRRATAVERQQQAKEEKIRKDKEYEVQRQQREREHFEKQFTEGIYLAKVTCRQTPIGTDRNHSRYWVFSDVTPGLYVEKGWVDDEIEYTIKPEDASDDIESGSSDDEDDGETTEGAPPTARRNKPHRMVKCVDTTFPHVGQNLWFTFDSMKDVDDLIKALHPQGSRESRLKKELQKRYQDISTAVFKSNKELRDCDGDKEMQATFKKEVLETELRLRHGGLGGVEDFPGWEARLETAVDLEPMGECLLETQEMVLEKFREGIFAPNKKRSEVKEEDDDDDEGRGMMVTGIIYWRDAVRTASTLTRLQVLLGILDSSVKWEKSSENAKCKICRKKGEEDKLLLCDACNQAFHMYCLRPALMFIPQDDWHCPACAPQYRKRVRDVPGRYKEYSQNNSDDGDDSAEEEKVKANAIKHGTECVECGGDEELISCAECPSVYHLECHDPPLRHPPRGRWVCNDCKSGVKRRTRRGSQRAARRVNRGAAKRKRVASSSDEEDESSDSDAESSDSDSDEETFKPPPKKAVKQSKKQTTVKRGRKPKQSVSPKTGRPKGKKTAAPSPPEVEYDNRPKASRRAPSELSVIENIIDQMLQFKDSWPFTLLVKKHDVPDYYKIIKNPISFQRIKDRLNCLVYGGPQEVIDAVGLLFRNAVEYNKTGTEVFDCIETSEKHFMDLLKRALPFYGYSRYPKGGDVDSSSPEGKRSRRSK